jgi:peroxiredoxin
MVATNSCMLPIGTKSPTFSLPDVLSNKETQLASNKDANGYLIAFICNHCPFVIHLLEHFPAQFNKIKEAEIDVFAISSNDIEKYPQDSPDKMRHLGLDYNFEFPYLYDESQQVAKSFNAACTPDFFLFDENLELFYRGRYDASRPGSTEGVSGKDLLGAVDALLKKEKAPTVQLPSIGCNIKWRLGNEPDYFKK